MQDNTGQARPDFESTKTEISDTIKKEKQSATRALHDAQDAVSRKASEYASDAKDALFEHAEGTQQNLSANMAAFGGALRAASEHLANSDQRAASKFVLDAAGGLERLSSSLKNKPFEEVLGRDPIVRAPELRCSDSWIGPRGPCAGKIYQKFDTRQPN